MNTIPYRNVNGFLIEEGKQVVFDARSHVNGSTVARYIFCPNINGLLHIDGCNDCPFLKKRTAKGVMCKSTEEYNPPMFYNVTKKEYDKRNKKTDTPEVD